MKQVDMSDQAVTARLRRVSQLRRLCLSLQKAKLPAVATTESKKQGDQSSSGPAQNPK